jgi:N-acetylmuramoyl-L-alanine amidase
MIVSALVALQIAAAPTLVIRAPNGSVRVPTVASAAGPMLRAESLAPAIPIRVVHDSSSWYTLDVWGAKLQIETGVAIVRVGNDVRQLAAAPTMQGGKLMIPLQLVSDVFPSSVPNVRWDAESSQLVLFTAAAGVTSAGDVAIQQSGGPARPVRSTASSMRGGGPLPPIPAKVAGKRTVIVDAGHGGVDNGMSGPIGGGAFRIYEKNITLAVAKRLGAQLASRGVDVVYTRTTDTLIALDDRGRIANRAQGDLFISIHVNAANPNWKDPGGSRGFETYFLSEARTEDARRVEQMENDAVKFETGPSNVNKSDPLSFILSDMQQNEHLRESSELADIIQQRLAKMHPGPSRGVKQAGFRVLVTAYMPAVLVEIGFGTNPREAQFISDPDKQTAIASAVADAAMEYLARYEDRVRGTRSGGARR